MRPTVAFQDPSGSMRTFFREAALPAGGNAVHPGLVDPNVVLYALWMEWHASNQAGRSLSMGDTLRLTGEGSATALRSRAPALLHILRTRHSAGEAPCLGQARARYGLSEPNAALRLLQLPDEDLEEGEVTTFAEGAGEATPRLRPANAVYDETGPAPLYAVVCDAFPREPAWCPSLPPATHMPRSLAHPLLSPPLSRNWGAHHRGHSLWQQHPCTFLLLLVVAAARNRSRLLGATPTRLYGPLHGAAPVPRHSPPAGGDPIRGTHLPADPGSQRHLRSPLSAAPPGSC